MKEGYRAPEYVFFSGALPPPLIPSKKKYIDSFSEEQFFSLIQDLGGTPPEVLNNKELFSYYAPILKADFLLLENYMPNHQFPKVNSNVLVMHGKDDFTRNTNTDLWNELTTQKYDEIYFEGNHFYIFRHIGEILTIISRKLFVPEN